MLDVQWPKFSRVASRNEAFAGMSGALRAFDTDSDGRLSIDEAHAALTDGGMEIPPPEANLTFI